MTGVSGYVGGHTVMRIMEQHPEWHVVLLVRNEEQKNIVLARWPKAEIIIGDLDDKELMISEGSKADVILRTFIEISYLLFANRDNQRPHLPIIFLAYALSSRALVGRSQLLATSSTFLELECLTMFLMGLVSSSTGRLDARVC